MRSDAAESVDLVDVLGPQLLVVYAEALLGCQAEHADLSLVGVAVYVGGWAMTQLWMFWLAPIVGALCGAFFYHKMGGPTAVKKS